MYLLGFDRGVDRQRVERWSDLFIRSLRPRSEVDLEKAMQMVRKVFPLWQPLGRDMPAGVHSYAAEGAESDRLSWREADR
jgi:hypothetical protein